MFKSYLSFKTQITYIREIISKNFKSAQCPPEPHKNTVTSNFRMNLSKTHMEIEINISYVF
jgi:hypothetical protein